jgi:hypothetical protein
VQDLAGTSWSDMVNALYTDHFDQFLIAEDDGVYRWEFSLKVFNDTYDDSNPEASRVLLEDGKIMGLSLAYCDNDDREEDPKVRDNFYGSVYVPAEAYNSHWEDAEYFGTAKLSGEPSLVLAPEVQKREFNIYPNPSGNQFTISMKSDQRGWVQFRILDLLGAELQSVSLEKKQTELSEPFVLNNAGIYILEAVIGSERFTKQLVVMHE